MNFSRSFRNKIFSREILVCLAVIVLTFTLDRLSKVNIIKQQLSNERMFINDYINFDLVWNTGIGFGLLSQNANIYYHTISFLIFSALASPTNKLNSFLI